MSDLVYVLLSVARYDSTEVLGVYSTKERAEKEKKTCATYAKENGCEIDIEECVLNE